MPFLVIKLVPIVEAAVVAQGIHSAPARAAQSGLQYSYYLQGVRSRLATGPIAGVDQGAGGGPVGGVESAGGPARGSDPATRSVDTA